MKNNYFKKEQFIALFFHDPTGKGSIMEAVKRGVISDVSIEDAVSLLADYVKVSQNNNLQELIECALVQGLVSKNGDTNSGITVLGYNASSDTFIVSACNPKRNDFFQYLKKIELPINEKKVVYDYFYLISAEFIEQPCVVIELIEPTPLAIFHLEELQLIG